MSRYAIGVDFGTLSVRAVLVDVESGAMVATCTDDYPHAVMDRALSDGTPLRMNWALQHPQDYLDGISRTVRGILREAAVSPDNVIGLGVDFTSCTLVPVKADGTPLCFLPQFANRPHAYVKLWKHHAAQPQANRLNALAEKRGEPWLAKLGGKISSECLIPKALQLLEEDEALYNEIDFFLEAGDWLVWQLTGVQTRNACMAGYRGMWDNGYPSEDFFAALDGRMRDFAKTKLNALVIPIGRKAGEIDARGSALTGLLPGTAVAAAVIDAHVAMPAAGIDVPGRLLSIIGTSACHLVLGEAARPVPGICGAVDDGMMPGYCGFEAGQTCVGDHFQWFVENCLPQAYTEAAEKAGISVHQYLRQKAEALHPGQSGLLALDWWNGNRSILMDGDLTGVLLGMTLQTKPEEIYRALIEATAYGLRVVLDNYCAHGVDIREYYATGGIAHKDPMMMQIYADVTGLPVHIAETRQCGGLGSALYACVAAGAARGGYDDIYTAVKRLVGPCVKVYDPIAANSAVYDRLYAQYKKLHDLFGHGGCDVMYQVKQIRRDVEDAAITGGTI